MSKINPILKSIKKILKQILVLCISISSLLFFPKTILASETPSTWAKNYITAAIEADLVPLHLQSNYTQVITRQDFCALAVMLYESVKGEVQGRTTFSDTNDINVEKAAYIGIIFGVEDGKFDPHALLTREQAAVILMRIAERVLEPLNVNEVAFLDTYEISSWAIESVGWAVTTGIMNGVGNNIFAPQYLYTREQSIVTMMRLFELMKNRDTNVKAGAVVIISDGIKYEPSEHFQHVAMYIDGQFMSGSGITFESWLNDNLESVTKVRYSNNIKVLIEGEHGEVVTDTDLRAQYYLASRGIILTGIPSESFYNGVSRISPLLIEDYSHMIYFDVWWAGNSNEFIRIRYVFKIVG